MLYFLSILQMVKSNAQRCRESRDRRRARGPQYHIDERARSAARYVPSAAQLTPEARTERNLKGKQSMALQRAALAPPRNRKAADPTPGPAGPGPDIPAADLAADLAADPAAGPAAAHAAAPGPTTSTDAVCTRLQAILLGCSNAK